MSERVGQVVIVGAGPGSADLDHRARRAPARAGGSGAVRRARLRGVAHAGAGGALVLRREARLPPVDLPGRAQPPAGQIRASRAARRAAQVRRSVRVRARRRRSARARARRHPVRDRARRVVGGGGARAGGHSGHAPRAGLQLRGRHRPPRGDLWSPARRHAAGRADAGGADGARAARAYRRAPAGARLVGRHARRRHRRRRDRAELELDGNAGVARDRGHPGDVVGRARAAGGRCRRRVWPRELAAGLSLDLSTATAP